MQANLNQEEHVNVQLFVKREEDEGMRVQVDFYEALTKWTEEGINKMTTDKNLKKVEDLEKWYCQDPPEYIKQKLESIRILIGNTHSTSRMLYSTAVVNKESLDQKPEEMAYDGNNLD
ncbi:Hypothetical predicted protein [Mytilus galloprovincialis]|uniref:Uncharacterized protein n=1 Tax=Mytilus galloprovincialis TaxID=29158 RepID=A0A8B6EL37_MYTGA|nr:Hypothetical predicted protein [Mytilus galloprovincialis]